MGAAEGGGDRGSIAAPVIAWQRVHGRHDLPWQVDDPYRVWVSEVMLQQTQVGAVVPYYLRFVARFPDVDSLARAGLEEVLEHWSGLGYYSRARNLHACAREIVDRHGGTMPCSPDALARLPGIGRSTAAAIASLAFGARAAILDGNVRRVLCRVFGVEGYPGRPEVERVLWAIAERELPEDEVDVYNQGLMDLGATLCTRRRPGCDRCPLAQACVARAQGRIDALPSPRPRRAVPERATTMLVLRCGGRVLLERRPPRGIWGGLWSLPERAPRSPGQGTAEGTADDAAAEAAAEAHRHGLAVRATRRLPGFSHQFTHFRLAVQPLLVDLAPPAARDAAVPVDHQGDGDMSAGGDRARARWFDIAEVDAAALPRPVKSLLQRLRDSGA